MAATPPSAENATSQKADGVLLTVLLPVRNETMNLRIMLRILRSVLTMPHEIVVIFDSETDTSIAVVEEVRATYPQVRPLLNKIGRGVAEAGDTAAGMAACMDSLFRVGRARGRSVR